MGINDILARGLQAAPTWGVLDSRKKAVDVLRREQMLTEAPKRFRREQEAHDAEMEKFEYERKRRPFLEFDVSLDLLERAERIISPRNFNAVIDVISPISGITRSPYPTLRQVRELAESKGFVSDEEFEEWFEQDFKPDFFRSQKSKVEQAKAAMGRYKVVGNDVFDVVGQKVVHSAGSNEEAVEWKTSAEGELIGLPKKVKRGVPPKPVLTGIRAQEKADPEILKLINEHNQIEDPNTRKILMARINKLTETQGLAVRVNRDGTVELLQGPGVSPSSLSKPVQAQTEKEILESTASLARLNAVEDLFDPKYQTYWEKFSNFWTAGREKAGLKISARDRSELERFSKYRQQAVNSLNLYIKQVTGAQLSEHEAERIMRGMPNPGTGIFDGDSPTEFKAKLRSAVSELKTSIARAHYTRRYGMRIDDLDLDDMKGVINKRAAALERELSASGLRGEKLTSAVKRKLAQEFGLGR